MLGRDMVANIAIPKSRNYFSGGFTYTAIAKPLRHGRRMLSGRYFGHKIQPAVLIGQKMIRG